MRSQSPPIQLSLTNESVFKLKSLALILASCICYSLALGFVNLLFSIIAISVVFYLILNTKTIKGAFLLGGLFGAGSSLMLNYWMFPVVMRYAQGSFFIGLVCYLASALVLGLFFALQFFLFLKLRVNVPAKFPILRNVFLFTTLWIIFEYFRGELLSGMPWLSFSAGITEARILYFIQHASYGGVHLLSFLLVFSASYIAVAIHYRRWKMLLIPLLIILFQFLSGIWMFNQFDKSRVDNQKSFSVALIIPTLSPETVWNERTADKLVNHLLSLNQKAIEMKPDLIVWTETVVPWTFSEDDDFIKEISNQIKGRNIYSLIGMNTALSGSGVILGNSVYLINPSGKSVGRYDKQDLLTLVEKPLFQENGKFILPFLSGSGVKMRSGNQSLNIETQWGKAGILLCNESTNYSLARSYVGKGSNFLFNLGNDNWFSGHFITTQHFFNSRLRAVENRKDIIINNNMGIAGVVRSSGEIAMQHEAGKSGVIKASVFPNSNSTLNHAYFILLCSIIFLTVTFLKLINK